jgi:drug/metabolite transporter (DMT)-like permease
MQPTAPARKPPARPAAVLSARAATLRAEAALFGATILWGGTFLAVHTAMAVSGPFFFVGLRFGTAALLSALVFRRALVGLTRAELLAGIAIAVSIFLGYGLQTVGLQTITSSESAFITALYVPIVPLMQWLVLRRPPAPMQWAGIGLAFVGLVLVAGPPADIGTAGLGFGQIITIVSTVAIAAEILLIGHYAPKVDVRRVTVVQLAATSLFSFASMPLTGEAIPAFSWTLVAIALGLGLASAVIQQAINWAQRVVPPTRATIIYTAETVFAGIIGWLAGDRLPAAALVGGALIVVGVLISEWRPGKPRPVDFGPDPG